MKKIIKFLIVLILLGCAFFYYQNFGADISLNSLKDLVSLPNQEEENLFTYTVNTNVDSDLALLGVSEDDKGFVAFTKKENGKEQLDKLILFGEDGTEAFVQVNDQALPIQFSTNGVTVEYTNYTSSTVDLTIRKPDGSVETIEGSPLNLPNEVIAIPFVKPVYAGSLGVSAQDVEERSGDDASYLDYLLSSTGTAINIVTCGVTLGSTLTTAGATSPFAYLKCAPLALRLATAYTEIGGCEGDVLDCAKDAFLDALQQKGPSIGGVVLEREDKKPISGASIVVTNKLGELKARAVSGIHGHYRLPPLDLGGYVMKVVSGGEEKTFILATTSSRIQISGEEQQALDEEYALGERKGFDKIFGYFGREVDQLFNVRFDILFGASGKYDGRWNGEALSSQELIPDPQDPNAYTECASASFSWEITDGDLTGSALVDNDYTVTLSGEVDAQGNITAGTGLSFIEQVTFTGVLDELNGAGTWQGSSGCSGTFTAKRELPLMPIDEETMPLF